MFNQVTEPLKRKWTAPLPAHKDPQTCIQADVPSLFFVTGGASEDCLFLNIYVPSSGSTNKTVLVNIPGGAFLVCKFIHIFTRYFNLARTPSKCKRSTITFLLLVKFGTASAEMYGPDFLISQDNIVVSLQYRVGIFGFLNLGHVEYSGNMGLKDIQLGLKWIFENIENFSGNKHEILLFGPSSGG